MFRTIYDQENKVWSGIGAPNLFNTKISVGHAILWSLERNPSKIGQINDETNIQLTNRFIRLKTIQAAQNLKKRGYEKGDVFTIIAKNSHYLAPIVFASVCLGCPINCLDVSFAAAEMVHMMSITQPSAVFCDADVYELVKNCLDELENGAKVYTFSGQTGDSIAVEELFVDTGNEENFNVTDVDGENHVAIITCTSGSTGLPKGVCLSHATLLNQIYRVIILREDVALCFSSLYWISGILVLFAGTICGNCRVITTERFSPELMLRMIEEHKVSYLMSASHYLVLSIGCEKFLQTNLSSIRVVMCGGTKLSTSVAIEVLKQLKNGTIITCYGMSEMGGLVSAGMVKSTGDESMGQLIPGMKAKVVNGDGDCLETGEMGEICLKPEFGFMGYYHNDEATQNSLDNENFLLTGDVGYFDENGNIYLVDRKKELLKYCASQISPTELEQFLIRNDGIKAVCVVGIPDPVAGDLPAAVIVLNEDAAITEEEIDEMVTGHFVDYKRLRGGIYFVNSFPLTASGKVLRRAVKEMAIDFYNRKHIDE